MLTKVRHAVGERVGRPRRWRVVGRGGVGAEIGVYKGDFSRELLAHVKPAKLHLIDGWWLVEGDSYEQPWYAAEGEADTRAAYREVERLANAYPNCFVHVGDDLEILPTFPDGYFDWVYLDSSHEFEHTVKKLELLRAKVKPGGIIAGHDWWPDPAHEHHGVYRAVTEFCGRYGLEVEAADPWNQWLVRT